LGKSEKTVLLTEFSLTYMESLCYVSMGKSGGRGTGKGYYQNL